MLHVLFLRFISIDSCHIHGKVHYLRETPTAAGGAAEVNQTSPPTSVLHLNHGFGASALSWESVMPSLSRALGTVVAHDTPGFGLTARPGIRRTESYSLRFNAGEVTVWHPASYRVGHGQGVGVVGEWLGGGGGGREGGVLVIDAIVFKLVEFFIW